MDREFKLEEIANGWLLTYTSKPLYEMTRTSFASLQDALDKIKYLAQDSK